MSEVSCLERHEAAAAMQRDARCQDLGWTKPGGQCMSALATVAPPQAALAAGVGDGESESPWHALTTRAVMGTPMSASSRGTDICMVVLRCGVTDVACNR